MSRRGVSGLAGVVEGRMKHASEHSEIPRDDCFGLGSVPTKRAFFFSVAPEASSFLRVFPPLFLPAAWYVGKIPIFPLYKFLPNFPTAITVYYPPRDLGLTLLSTPPPIF